DEAERMTGETPQAFLKTLEEPPAATVIILILTRARAVPATLLSRCQVVRFGPRADAGVTAARAQALEILAEVKAQGVDALFRRTDRLEREKAEALVDAYWLFCRDLLVAKSGAPGGLLIDPDHADELAREAEGWTVDQIVAAVDVCRQASDEEARAHRERREREERAIVACQRIARSRGLVMKVVDVEMHPVARRTTVYFNAEERIDFRDLVRDLARELRSRVEMRQIGARDTTKVMDGIGPCGRQLCCTSHLRRFDPISVKMAKAQDMPLTDN